MSATSVVYVVSLIFVAWAVIDIVRQPAWKMGRNRKLGWSLAAVVGWLFLGFVGAIVAGVYLIGVRPRLRAIH